MPSTSTPNHPHPDLPAAFHMKCLLLLWVNQIPQANLDNFSPRHLSNSERDALSSNLAMDGSAATELKYLQAMHSHGAAVYHHFDGELAH